MPRSPIYVLMCAAALMVGCANDGKNHNDKSMAMRTRQKSESRQQAQAKSNSPSPSQQSQPSQFASSANAPTTPPNGAGTGSEFNSLAGAWQLAMPRRHEQQAAITAIDATHVRIEAGEILSGDYVMQGNYLLMLSRDERLRPIAWKINTPDSLTVVRGPDIENASTFTGVGLLRAPDDVPVEASTSTSEAVKQ